MTTENEFTPAEQELISKYKTLARAIIANDAEACEVLHRAYVQSQGKDLTQDEVVALGLRWLMNKKENMNVEVADFLNKVGFDFNMSVILDQKTENTGTALPFRLVDGDQHKQLLVHLLRQGYVDKDVRDGVGDNLYVEVLSRRDYDLAEQLHALGVNVNDQNIGGETALHTFAGKLNFGAVQWLCEHGADPTIESLTNARPSEVVPEQMGEWNTDAMFNALEDYAEIFPQGGKFSPSDDYALMVEQEKPQEEGSDMTMEEFQDEVSSIIKPMGI